KNDDRALQNSLTIHSIQSVLKTAQQEFTAWSRSESHQVADLYNRLNSAFFSLLDGLTLARSRDHVQRYYQQSLAELGGFPQRSKPLSVHTEIDTADNFPDYDHINQQVSEYQLSLFNPSKYVLPPYHEHYAARGVQNNFSQEDREFYLIGMMKVNFLKRLESLIFSFRITLERTIEKIKDLEDKLHQFQQEKAGKVDLNALQVEAGDDEDLAEAWTVGKNAVFELKHLDVARWLKDLAGDRRQLHTLFLQAQDVTGERDGKLQRLKSLIAEKVKNPTQNLEGQANCKVLVFTAFADTAKYLYEQLQPWVSQELQIHSALVTGSNGNQCTWGKPQFEQILTHFSPRSKQRNLMRSLSQEAEIDLLIATDCISEGQNLQDCDYLINYDIHWNPVRIIQRFGRIDRLGSINKTVQLVNFWPVEDLNQ
ncbi:MAG: C-terminal helicase domain-containing protein, partial [Microcystaceae cyanobacterium]